MAISTLRFWARPLLLQLVKEMIDRKRLPQQRENLSRKIGNSRIDSTWESMICKNPSFANSGFKKNGYMLVREEDKNRLLRSYWSIPEGQIV